ncbi:MAG: DUF2344 domain-containing protein [Phycisphaerae bacterium]|nr:DUF2344 domain-containing protein [Phycisphaerae bacterium]
MGRACSEGLRGVWGPKNSGNGLIKATNDTILVLVKFRIWGNLRFLSHAETMKLFQRACVRAGVEVAHSEGFNPRPRMSLPLPRSVGVESDDELLGLVVACEGPRAPCGGDQAALEDLASQIQTRLADRLPQGCEMSSVTAVRGGKTPLPASAAYRLPVRREYLGDELKNRIKDLLAGDTLVICRQVGKKASKFKDVDVRGFLKSIELRDGGVSVECRISSDGSIRMEEILDLLGLDAEMLARPIKRISVRWHES